MVPPRDRSYQSTLNNVVQWTAHSKSTTWKTVSVKSLCEFASTAAKSITDQTSYSDRDYAQPLIVFKAPNRRSVNHYSTIFAYQMTSPKPHYHLPPNLINQPTPSHSPRTHFFIRLLHRIPSDKFYTPTNVYMPKDMHLKSDMPQRRQQRVTPVC